jgi:hypothetical protein
MKVIPEAHNTHYIRYLRFISMILLMLIYNICTIMCISLNTDQKKYITSAECWYKDHGGGDNWYLSCRYEKYFVMGGA